MYRSAFASGLQPALEAAALRTGASATYVRYDAKHNASHVVLDGSPLIITEHAGSRLSAKSSSAQLMGLVVQLEGSSADAIDVARVLTTHAAREASRASLRPRVEIAECYREAWPEGDGDGGSDPASAEQAFDALCAALDALQQHGTDAARGISAAATRGNPFVWNVRLSAFPEHSRLCQDLANHKDLFGSSGAVELSLRWTTRFPHAPPVLRVVQPMFKPHTGGIVAGALCLPQWLAPRAWGAERPLDGGGGGGGGGGAGSQRSVVELLAAVRTALQSRGAQVRLDTAAAYPLPAFRAAHRRLYAPTLQQLRDAAATDAVEGDGPLRQWSAGGSTHDVLGTLRAISATYATEILAFDMSNHPGFNHGKRVLLPMSFMQQLDELARADGDDEASAFVGGGVNFSLTTPSGIRAFCGVHFDSPDDAVCVVPDWVMHSLGIESLTRVDLRKAELPHLTFFQLQPCSSTWLELGERVGLDKSTFLEEALRRYTTLARGETISLESRGASYDFSVVDCRPLGAPAGQIFTGFLSEVSTDFLVPADLVVAEERAAAASKHGGGSGGGGGEGLDMLRPAVLQRQLSDERREVARRMEEIHREQIAAKAKAKKARQRARELPGFDATAPKLQMRLALTVARYALADEVDEIAGAVPRDGGGASLTASKLEMRIRANCGATAAELYAFVDSVLETHGPVPRYTLVKATTGGVLPRDVAAGGDATLEELGLKSVLVKQVVERVVCCDAPVQWRCAQCTLVQESKEGGEAVTSCSLCHHTVLTGGHAGAVRAYAVGSRGEQLGLCAAHKCGWLEQLLLSNSLEREDVAALTKEFVLSNLSAELV